MATYRRVGVLRFNETPNWSLVYRIKEILVCSSLARAFRTPQMSKRMLLTDPANQKPWGVTLTTSINAFFHIRKDRKRTKQFEKVCLISQSNKKFTQIWQHRKYTRTVNPLTHTHNTHIHINTHTCTCTHAHTHMHIHIPLYTHTHTHIYTHTHHRTNVSKCHPCICILHIIANSLHFTEYKLTLSQSCTNDA